MYNYFLLKLKCFKRVDYSLMLNHLAAKFELPIERVEKEILENILLNDDEVGVAKNAFFIKEENEIYRSCN